jgi:uncharacterized protein YxeA
MFESKYIILFFLIIIIILFHSKNINIDLSNQNEYYCNSCTRKRRIHNHCDTCENDEKYIETFNNVKESRQVTFNLTPQTFYY